MLGVCLRVHSERLRALEGEVCVLTIVLRVSVLCGWFVVCSVHGRECYVVCVS